MQRDDEWFWYRKDDSEWSIKKEEKRCQCGVTITLGKDDDPMFHSNYCPINPEYKDVNKEQKDPSELPTS